MRKILFHSNLYWTAHSKRKMRQYQLSESRIKRLLRNFNRKEKGIVPNTVAVMSKAGTVKRPYEIWTMFQKRGQKIIIITAWKYPGTSPIREGIPIPLDILEELKRIDLVSEKMTEF